MHRRRWYFWLGVALITLFALSIVASMAIGVWRFAALGPGDIGLRQIGPNAVGPYGRGFYGHEGWVMGPGMMGWGFGFMGPLWTLLILGLIAWGIWALFNRGRMCHGYGWSAWPTCPNCHRPARPDWRVCPYCGHQLYQQAAPPSPPPPPPQQPQPPQP